MAILQYTPPRQLCFDCNSLNEADIRCSQAFPDLIHYKDRFFLTFRTAPSHFPSKNARIHVFNSADGIQWELQHSFNGGLDVRDPHFVIFQGKLHLFFMSHNRSLTHPGPMDIYHSMYTKGTWSKPRSLSMPNAGFWNVKAFNGHAYMSVYTHKGNNNHNKKRHLQFLRSPDLVKWETITTSPKNEALLSKYQTSETAFDFDEEGNIYGTIRSLIYPNLNFSFPNHQPEEWKIKVDKFKCDGPRLFTAGKDKFLIARRSFFYDLPSKPYQLLNTSRNFHKLLRYSLSRKRTAIYQFDPHTLQIKHLIDLPSHGDTGYAAVEQIEEGKFLAVYYSSDISRKKDYSWLRGQLDTTRLYSTTITITD